MMHCTMDDLLALRAGEASAWARRHVEDCAACRAELDGLYQRVAQLKALPALRPPRDRWSVVRDAAQTQRARRRRTWGGWALAAAAALVGVLLVPRFGGGSKLHAELAQAKDQSATLEDQLQNYDVDGRVLTGRDRKSTRLNSSHLVSSYAVFCLKKKNKRGWCRRSWARPDGQR